MAAATQCRVESFVYFDLEATGLPSHGKPRITELSMVAVSRDELEQLGVKTNRGLVGQNGNRKEHLEAELVPRVLNKLVMCVYPMATILPKVTELTGLDNYNLQGQSTFDSDLVATISSFLSRLPDPVCLVAHNGARYDFPLLQAELHKVGSSLCSSVLCCDSWPGISAVLQERDRREKTRTKEELDEGSRKSVEEQAEEASRRIEAELQERSSREEAGGSEELVAADGGVQGEVGEEVRGSRTPPRSSTPMTPPPSERKREGGQGGSLTDPKMRRSGEGVTPERRSGEEPVSSERVNGEGVSHEGSGQGVAPVRKAEVALPLTPQAEGGAVCVKQTEVTQFYRAKKKLNFTRRVPILPPSYSLPNLHLHLLGSRPATSHGAEADCLALLRTTAVLGQDWLSWVDLNCQPFHTQQKMWTMANTL